MGRNSRKKKERSAIRKAAAAPEPLFKNTGTNELKIKLSVFLGILAFALYANTLKNSFAFDDALAVSQNTFVQKGASAIPDILKTNLVAGYKNGTSTMYRPFTLSMLAIEWELSPNDPFIHHLVNCIFFALTAILLFFVLSRLFLKRSLLIPFLATLLFVVHPIHTEVVANIKSRDELMSLFFSLLSFLYLFRYMEKKKTAPLIFAGLFYFSALMFKETAVPMLVIFPLLLYFFTAAEKKDYLKVMMIMGAALIIQLAIRTQVLENQTGLSAAFLKTHNSLLAAGSFGEKTASIMMILARYLLLLFFPYPLSSDYSFNQVALVNWNSPWAFLSFIVYAGLVLICVLRFRKKEAWVFGIIFYLVSMALFSNIFIMIGATIGERFLYTPSFGFCIAVVSLLALLAERKKNTPMLSFFPSIRFYNITVLIIVLAAIPASFKIIDRNKDWKNNSVLFSTDIKKSPNSAPENYWYAQDIMVSRALTQKDTILKRHMLDTAMIYLDNAIAIYPDYGDAYSLRGLANLRLGRTNEAVADYYKAIYYDAAKWSDYNNLGIYYGQRNMLDSSIYCFNRAIKLDASQPLLQKNLGSIFEFKQDYAAAIGLYQKALALNENKNQSLQKEIYSHLANCYRQTGDISNANYYQQLNR